MTNNSASTLNKQDLYDRCRQHMFDHGLPFEDDLITDGNLHRFSSTQDRKKRDEWYIASEGVSQKGNPYLNCTYGSWNQGVKYAFKSYDESTFFDKIERKELHELHRRQRLETERKLEEGRDEVAIEVQKLWSDYYTTPKANPEEFLAYVTLKGIEPIGGVRFGKNPNGYLSIIIPLMNIDGELRTLQYISLDKQNNKSFKIFHPGGEKRGNYFIIGEIIDGNPFYIAEGYATGVSVYMATEQPVVIAFDAGNIDPVLENLRKKYPINEITIAGDDDETGREKAYAAAKKYNCKVATPSFKKDGPEGNKCTDFNDLHQIRGLGEVQKQLESSIYIKKDINKEIKSAVPQKKQRKGVVEIPQNGLPTIQITPGQLHNTTNRAEQILSSKDLGIFQRGGQLVRIITEVSKPKKNKLLDREGVEIIKRSSDSLLITEVDPIYLTELLGRHANWTKYDERSGKPVIKDCPERIAKTLIARREWNVPVLAGIIQAPTLRSDGSILENPGYDELTGLYFNPGETSFPKIPSHPNKDDATSSLNVLLDLLKGFPFENEESKSVALSAILTGLIRKSIRTAPLHGYTAPKMGTGKSLLADVVGLIATGKNNSVIPQAENEGEEKKRLLSVLAEGDSIICYDNIEQPFGSSALCSVLTQEEFKDRLLGHNRSLSVSTNATFLATGNNLTFIGDTSTRAILCGLDPQCERPEERNFDIDLRKFIPQNRGELVKAGLTILRAYYVAGRPKQNIKQYGRFEDWSDWVRSSLIWLEMSDPCASRKEIENADPNRISLSVLLTSWYDYFGDISFTLANAISKAEKENSQDKKEKAENLLDAFKEISSGKNEINKRSLGKKLASFKGRIENGYCLDKTGKSNNVDTWRVRRIS